MQSGDENTSNKRKKKSLQTVDESLIEHPRLPEIVKLMSQVYKILMGIHKDPSTVKKRQPGEKEEEETEEELAAKRKTHVLNDLSENVRQDRITE